MISGIYIITNTINNKVYIGQSKDIQRRWIAHRYDATHCRDNYPIHRAMRKYSLENFSFDILEELEPNLLNERERYWIQYYNSTDSKYGYNIRSGGHDNFLGNLSKKPINQYDLNGNFIKSYESIVEASQQNNNISQTGISACANRKQKTAFGYQWRFCEDEQDILMNYKIKYPIKKVCQYDLQGNYIQTFKSANQAGLAVGLSKGTAILNVCKHKHGGYSAGGFIWAFEGEEPIIEKFCTRKRPVYQCDLNGNILNKFESQSAAARAFNISSTTIQKACNNNKTIVGYKWKYADTHLINN